MCAAVLAVAAPAWASGDTLYVAGIGAAHYGAAADTGNCQVESAPCATIAYALSVGGGDPTVAVAGYDFETGIVIGADATIEQDPLDPADPAEVAARSGDGGSIFEISGGANVNISGLTIASAQPNGNSGGGIADQSTGTLTLRDVVLNSDGATHDGGELWVDGSGEVDISDSTFESGYTGSGNGGAIAVDSGATVNVRSSTFADNTSSGDGGAVYLADPDAAGTTIVSSTFYDNAANGAVSTATLSASAAGNTVYAGQATPDFAGDIFYGTCSIGASDTVGDPLDAGYNAGTDGSCLPAAGDRGPSDVESLLVRDMYDTTTFAIPGGLETVTPGAENPAVGLVPDDTTVSAGSWLGGQAGEVALCPVTDEAGITSSGACNAGSSQATVARPVVYVAGANGSDPSLGTGNDATGCGTAASPCATIRGALLYSSALDYRYTDPIIDVDGIVDEDASQVTPAILDYPVVIQQDPDAASMTATISGVSGSTPESLFYVDGGPVTISGLTLTEGAPAIYDFDSSAADSLRLEDDTISNSGTSGLEGGAVYISTPSNVTIDHATFSDNTARDGGSVWIGNGSSVHVDDSSFSGDTASGYGGGIALSIGVSTSSTLWVDDSNFSDESAGSSGEGGAIAIGAGTVAGTAHITNTVFENDSANQGGAIANGEYGGPAELDVSGSIFFDDTGFLDGGAISNAVYSGSAGTPDATISDSVFELNTSYGDGGAIDNADLGGSGTLTISGASFYDNGVLADPSDALGPTWDGGAIDNGDSDGGYFSSGAGTVSVVGSTFYGNYLADGSNASGTAFEGPAIDEGSTAGDSATVAGDLFDGVASQLQPAPSGNNATLAPLCDGTFTDSGYNAGTDGTCFGTLPYDHDLPDLDAQIGVLQPNVTQIGSPPVTLNTGTLSSVPLVEPKLLGTSALLGVIASGVASPISGQELCPAADILGSSAVSGYGGCAPGAFQSNIAERPTAAGYPTQVTAVAGDPGRANVSWTPPSLRDAGGQIDSFTVIPLDVTTGQTGAPQTTSGAADSVNLGSLNGGDSYTFTVVTNNSATGQLESSGPSAASNAVQVKAQPPASQGATTTTNTTPTITPVTTAIPVVSKPSSTSSSVTLDHIRLTLTTPPLSSCAAPGRSATVHMAASRSGRTPLKFVRTTVTLAGKQSTTLRHSSGQVAFKIEGLKAGRYPVRAVFSFRESLPHRRTKLVSRTITGRLSVC